MRPTHITAENLELTEKHEEENQTPLPSRPVALCGGRLRTQIGGLLPGRRLSGATRWVSGSDVTCKRRSRSWIGVVKSEAGARVLVYLNELSGAVC